MMWGESYEKTLKWGLKRAILGTQKVAEKCTYLCELNKTNLMKDIH